MQLYKTSEYMNNEISFKIKMKKLIHYKMKLYTTSGF